MMLFEPSAALTRNAEARINAMAPHLRPLWLPVAVNDCALAHVFQGDGAFVIPTTRPALVVFGDDEAGKPALGPGAFHRPSLLAFLARCGSALLVSGAPDLSAYAWAGLCAAVSRHDCAVIETRPEREDEWLALFVEAPRERSILVSSPTRREAVH